MLLTSVMMLCPFYLHAVQFTSWHSNGHNWILLQILPLWFPCRLRKLTSSLFTFTEAEPSPYLESSQRKNQCTYKAKCLSAQILQSTNPQVLENTGKAHTIQKLAGTSIAKGKVAGKRKKTNRKCHTQRIQHKLWAIKARKKKSEPTWILAAEIFWLLCLCVGMLNLPHWICTSCESLRGAIDWKNWFSAAGTGGLAGAAGEAQPKVGKH